MKKQKTKRNKGKFIKICSFIIIIICSIVISLNLYVQFKDTKKEKDNLNNFFEKQEIIINDNEKIVEENNNTDIEKEMENLEEFLGVLEIPKIKLIKGFYSINSKNNKVDKNIQLMKESQMPDMDKGNLIIAGHSGNAYTSYFRNLHKLNKDDIAKIYYMGKTYDYKLMNSYEIEKNGIAHIKRNAEKNTLTLITCKDNSNKQLVFIFELVEV